MSATKNFHRLNLDWKSGLENRKFLTKIGAWSQIAAVFFLFLSNADIDFGSWSNRVSFLNPNFLSPVRLFV